MRDPRVWSPVVDFTVKVAEDGRLSLQTSYKEVLPVFKTGFRYPELHLP